MKNKLEIKKLLDEKYMIGLFWKERESIDNRIKKITSLVIRKIKFFESEKFQHAVINYQLNFYDQVNWPQYLSIYVSAHSDGTRQTSFKFMKYIHHQGFGLKEFYSSTKPLFYLDEIKGSFHQELIGHNITYIIQEKPELLPEALLHAGKCLAKFHQIPKPTHLVLKPYPFSSKQLDPSNISQRTGSSFLPTKIMINELYPKMEKFFLENHKIFNRRVFSHGDFHLENIIIGTNFIQRPLPFRKVGIIDYTDVCWADRGLDLGSFIQKINFTATYKLGYSPSQTKELEDLFLENYLHAAGLKLDHHLQTGIYFWYIWNNLRVIINYFLYPEKKAAFVILEKSLQQAVNKLAI